MIFQALSDGNLRLLDAANTVYQGSVGTRMYVISPDVGTPSATGMMVSFTYPDGTISSTAFPMEALYAAEGAGLEGLDVRIWSYRLRAKETERKGDLGVSVSMVNGEDVITSYAGLVNIAYSAVPAPAEPPEDDFATLQALLSQYYGYITSVVGNNDDLATEASVIVNAINEVDDKATTIGHVADTAYAITLNNRSRINILEQHDIDGEHFVGMTRASTEVGDPPNRPTAEQLDAFVNETEGRPPQAGDVVIWVTDPYGATDVTYKCMYFLNVQEDTGTPWNWWQIGVELTANNFDYGSVRGGAHDGVNLNITSGNIKDISTYTHNNWVSIKTTAQKAADAYDTANALVDGTTPSAKATDAVNDEQHNNIVQTYAKKVNTYTKSEVNDRFMSKHFGRILYLSVDADDEVVLVKDPPATAGALLEWADDYYHGFYADRVIAGDYLLESETQLSSVLWLKTNADCVAQITLSFSFKHAGATEFTEAASITTGMIGIHGNEMTRIDLAGNLVLLAEEYHVTEGDTFRYVWNVQTIGSLYPPAPPELPPGEAFTVELYSDLEHPSTVNFEIVPTSVVVNYANGYQRVEITREMLNDVEPRGTWPEVGCVITPEMHHQPISTFYDIKVQREENGIFWDVVPDTEIDEGGNIHFRTLTCVPYTMWVASGRNPEQ